MSHTPTIADLLEFIHDQEQASQAEIEEHFLEDLKDEISALVEDAENSGLIEDIGAFSHTYELTDDGEDELVRIESGLVEDDEDDDDDDDDDEHTVFLVHGRDRGTLREVETFVRREFRQELDVKVLIDLPDRGSETVYSKLERNVEDSDIAIVIYAAEEEVVTAEGREGRPRPNVLIELGMFLAKLGPERVFVLSSPGVALPSDLEGSIHISFKGQWQAKLQKNLRHLLDE